MNDLTLQQKPGGLGYVDPAAVAAAETAKALIQSAYIMAYQKPRSEDQARARILEACKRPVFAERVEYAKPVGGRSIKGPSIRFAELALREWGNVRADTQVVYEDTNIRRIKLTCTDLETNTSFNKEIQISKTVERRQAGDREVVGERTNTTGQKVFIVKATDDELHNKEAALISKALRNEGLRLIPSDIVDDAIDTAKETLRNRDKGDPLAAKKKIMDAFLDIGIKPKDLEKYLNHKMDTVSPAELQDLRGIYRAIKDGEANWQDYIGKTADPELPEVDPAAAEEFDRQVKENSGPASYVELFTASETYVAQIAKVNKQTPEAVKAQAGTPANFPTFWQSFLAWHNKPERKPRSDKGTTRRPQEPPLGETATQSPTLKNLLPEGGTGPVRGIQEGTLTALVKELDRTKYETEILCQDWEVTTIDELSEEAGQNALTFLKGLPDIT